MKNLFSDIGQQTVQNPDPQEKENKWRESPLHSTREHVPDQRTQSWEGDLKAEHGSSLWTEEKWIKVQGTCNS